MLQKKVAVLAKAGLSMEGFTEPKEDLLMVISSCDLL